MRTAPILALILTLAAAPVLAAPSAEKASPDTVDVIRDDDPAMAKATADARATLPTFLGLAGKPQPGMRGFAVKVGIGPAGGKEFVWITPFSQDGDTLTGQIANEPERVKGFFTGQTLKMPVADVTDWTYLDHGKMKGNYSACALMGRKTEAEKAEFRRRYDLDCAAR